MKKWKCLNEECAGKCEIYTEQVPLNCVLDDECADWEKVTEEPVTDCNQLATNCSQLPDWFKVGEWVYVPEIKEYCKITDTQGDTLIDEHGDHLPYQDCVQAHLRPYNVEEMRALVGKVLEWDCNLELVTKYNDEYVEVFVDGLWADAKFLMNNGYTIDGYPCGVFEYLENGEWTR